MQLPDSGLHKFRLEYQVKLPKMLENALRLITYPLPSLPPLNQEIATFFPDISNKPYLAIKNGESASSPPLRIAALFSGGQAPGGHNVISGLFDFLKELHPDSELFGFLGGPSGLIKNHSIPLTKATIQPYRNQGGFDLLGSGRTKIETPEQFSAAEKTVIDLKLDGLVIIGGDDSNTNAAFLAEHFISRGVQTAVIGIPKTIDGDLKNSEIECSFGFDSATKTYSELIGNIQRDALSAKKYCHFIRLMGRTASHITLECALKTRPNAALIGEEIAKKRTGLKEIVNGLADVICERSAVGKNYGVFLIPEGILEFIPECKILIKELETLLIDNLAAKKLDQIEDPVKKFSLIEVQLSENSKKCFQTFPKEIKLQLLQDRDPHGNIQVSQIDSERLIISLLKTELNERKANDAFKGTFQPLSHFYGYEGRACYPSDFDVHYCYSLGQAAGILIKDKATGYLACVKNLAGPISDWEVYGIPLTSMMKIEERAGKSKPVIAKAFVDLEGAPFKAFHLNRDLWALEDHYAYPGPIQYFGPKELTDEITLTLRLEKL